MKLCRPCARKLKTSLSTVASWPDANPMEDFEPKKHGEQNNSGKKRRSKSHNAPLRTLALYLLISDPFQIENGSHIDYQQPSVRTGPSNCDKRSLQAHCKKPTFVLFKLCIVEIPTHRKTVQCLPFRSWCLF